MRTHTNYFRSAGPGLCEYKDTPLCVCGQACLCVFVCVCVCVLWRTYWLWQLAKLVSDDRKVSLFVSVWPFEGTVKVIEEAGQWFRHCVNYKSRSCRVYRAGGRENVFWVSEGAVKISHKHISVHYCCNLYHLFVPFSLLPPSLHWSPVQSLMQVVFLRELKSTGFLNQSFDINRELLYIAFFDPWAESGRRLHGQSCVAVTQTLGPREQSSNQRIN